MQATSGPMLVDLASRTSVHVVSAALVMGCWAAFANRSHGALAAITAGLVQGAASAVVTCWLKTMLDSSRARFAGVLAFVVPPLLTSLLVFVVLVGAHRLAHTRELWATIAIPYAASFTYAWVYSALLACRPLREAAFERDKPRAIAASPADSPALERSPVRPDQRDGPSDGNAAARQHAVIVPHGSDDVAGAEYIET